VARTDLVVSRHDYMPFGEELGASVGGRTTGMGYSGSGDNNRKKFTGYERDSETGLDFAQARYHANSEGRFTSPDPLMASASAGRPQSWNRYAYCFNNPVRLTDPSGMSVGMLHQTSKGGETFYGTSFREGFVTGGSDYYEGYTASDRLSQEAISNILLDSGDPTPAGADDPATPQEDGADVSENPQNTERDVRVDAAFISLGRKQIEGKVGFAGDVSFSISSDDRDSFFAAEYFEVTLNLTLPKDTTNLDKTERYEEAIGTRQNSKGQTLNDTAEFVGGSRVTVRPLNHPAESNYVVNKGIVTFKDVNLIERTASATFLVHAKGGGTSNTLDVLILGSTRRGGIKTIIPVTIMPH
jgi:RHS repeat-associated protein